MVLLWLSAFLLLQWLHIAEAGLALPSSSSSQPQQPAKPQKQSSSQCPTRFPQSQQATPSDIATVMRQTGQVQPSRATIGVPTHCRCQHGFPQAVALDPFSAGRINSGLLKLTCPLLVRAVDALEDTGIMEVWNQQRLPTSRGQDKSTQPIIDEMTQRHAVHARVRQAMLSETDVSQIRAKLGDRGTRAFLEAGVAGASPGSHDVKCLHAWLADALFCGEDSDNNKTTTTTTLMGDRIAHELLSLTSSSSRSSSSIQDLLSGTPDCHRYCNPVAPLHWADPPKPRNKQRLRTSKETQRRRRRQKEQDDNKQTTI